MRCHEKLKLKEGIKNEHRCVRKMVPWVASISKLTVKEKEKEMRAKLVEKAGFEGPNNKKKKKKLFFNL